MSFFRSNFIAPASGTVSFVICYSKYWLILFEQRHISKQRHLKSEALYIPVQYFSIIHGAKINRTTFNEKIHEDFFFI